jgi:hypothetical protein
MCRRVGMAADAFVVVLTAQLVRPDPTNPTTDPTRTLQSQPSTSSTLVAVLDRSRPDPQATG